MATVDPILVQRISSHPFEYTEKGLTLNDHPRESIRDLTRWLKPKSKAPTPLIKKVKKMKKDWWIAQLRLYGIKASASTKVADLIERLRSSLAEGLKGPAEDIVELERKLGAEFLQQNAKAREKEYKSIDDAGRAEKYSERFLKETFFEKKEKLMALQMSSWRGSRLRQVASDLGLHLASTDGAYNWPWIIIGEDESAVLEKKRGIEKERREWKLKFGVTVEETSWPSTTVPGEDLENDEEDDDEEEEEEEERERDAKRRKVDSVPRQKGDSGSFKDVEGEWSIDCPKMDREYRDVPQHKKMSIFFHKPQLSKSITLDSDDEGEFYCSDDEGLGELNPSPEICSGSQLTLSATFVMGILEGILRSSAGNLPPHSASFPVPKLSFSWRGRETGEGEILFDSEGDQRGSLHFTSKTELKGILRSTFGDFSFTGTKVGRVPVDKRDTWEQYSERAHRREEISRWH